jgi:hypothetical protein
MRNRLIKVSLGLVGTVLFASLVASPMQAQGHGGRGFAPAGRGTATVSRRHASGGHFARMRRGRHFAGSGFGPNYYPYSDYYGSDYYPEYDYQDEADEALPPPFRAQVAAPAPPANASKAPEALVMELRGDHWVRLTSYGPMAVAGESGEPQSETAQAKRSVASARAQEPKELPPAVLVFRDGHQEEVAKYTIVGTTISVKTDYWKTGSWTRKIPIAELNLAATLQANQERGAKFSLPSRPSEVIVR